ncbi:hypothetical protein MMC18_004850 [Xylographa bjoerkii]|nr:hypothetical protein [Xylographa bjoerkii]
MPTIPAKKQSFLHSQTRLLSTPLSPSPTWHSNIPATAQNALPTEAIQDAIHKVNALIRAHNQRAYPAPALRHVAEQIDALYWAAGATDSQTGAADEGGVGRGADLREDGAIGALPDEWPEEEGEAADESGLEAFAEAARYKQLRARLVALSEARAAQRVKLAQAEQLRELLRPFERARENVQPNLVTRDGELARELERMKVLMARVGGKIGGVERRRGVENGQEVEEVDASAKVDAILGARPVEVRGD